MSDEFEALMPKPKEDDIGNKYRHVFSSPMGREVLADILTECHFMEVPDASNPHKCGEQGIGILILAKCGILGPDTKMRVIDALLNVFPKSKEVER